MQERLRRLVENRTRMLAAISHDLRTPITQLRLRAEFIEDADEQAKTLATLEEMEAMVALDPDLRRDDATVEPPRMVDLAALVGSLCDDLADAGKPVAFEPPAERIALTCRPAALKRAVANLIENAVKYGVSARVTIVSGARDVCIVIEDDGPGIPPDELENVFLPFYRIEKSAAPRPGSRPRLSVARSIADAHGGQVRLENREGGGLRVTLDLPR